MFSRRNHRNTIYTTCFVICRRHQKSATNKTMSNVMNIIDVVQPSQNISRCFLLHGLQPHRILYTDCFDIDSHIVTQRSILCDIDCNKWWFHIGCNYTGCNYMGCRHDLQLHRLSKCDVGCSTQFVQKFWEFLVIFNEKKSKNFD